ncbi:DNA-binding protein [Favolaschia claudopus]|uniref:DNA-binding protein n=1 Tax=Favolaschia claudopus TaxID=2862362 RepID=A0AAW0BPJ6_9AGAR
MLFLATILRWIWERYQNTPEPLPPTIRELVPNRKRVLADYPLATSTQWSVSRRPLPLLARLFRFRGYDTAAASFYRIYEFAVLHDNTRFRNEIEYFCHQPWPIASLPDPHDFDPERAAFLAALTRILCDSFNERIERGLPRDAPAYIEDFAALRSRPKKLETPPIWAQSIRPLDRPLRINAREEDPGLSTHLGEMGIIMKAPHYSFT